MPPKSDPYSNPRARFIDLLLCLITIALIVLAILTAPRHQRAESSAEDDRPPAKLAVK